MANEAGLSQLRAFFERAERLQREADETAQAQKDLLGELKGAGFDVAVFKSALRIRRQDKAAVAERTALEKLYLDAAEEAQS